MNSYDQGFIEKCAQYGLDPSPLVKLADDEGVGVGDVIKFLLPVVGAAGIGSLIGAGVGAIRPFKTATEGAVEGAVVGAGAGLGKSIVKSLDLDEKIKNLIMGKGE